MESKWCGLRAEREKIKPEPPAIPRLVALLENEIADWERALAGDRRSAKHQELTIQLQNMKDKLLHMKRRMAGRTPQMKSWADPL